eukprot:GHVU01189056.1.p1 GENE.GHVU01189056.1~~GHVU01189056.1.p1  ORF type:complete len:148 (-),score=17.91 GHVU01189056.1:1859-2302(-)
MTQGGLLLDLSLPAGTPSCSTQETVLFVGWTTGYRVGHLLECTGPDGKGPQSIASGTVAVWLGRHNTYSPSSPRDMDVNTLFAAIAAGKGVPPFLYLIRVCPSSLIVPISFHYLFILHLLPSSFFIRCFYGPTPTTAAAPPKGLPWL